MTPTTVAVTPTTVAVAPTVVAVAPTSVAVTPTAVAVTPTAVAAARTLISASPIRLHSLRSRSHSPDPLTAASVTHNLWVMEPLGYGSQHPFQPLQRRYLMKNTGTLQVTTPSDKEIVLTRVFDAPRHLVFDALTKPELLKRWFGPRGWSLVVCDVDLRVGGAWRFVLRGPDGTEMGMSGIYREIARPERIGPHREVRRLSGRIGRDHGPRREGREDDADGHGSLRVEGDPRRGASSPAWSTARPRATTSSPSTWSRSQPATYPPDQADSPRKGVLWTGSWSWCPFLSRTWTAPRPSMRSRSVSKRITTTRWARTSASCN